MSQFSVDTRETDFQQNVLDASFEQPVLVDFWAPWCGPCRSLTPVLEKLADEYGGRFRLAKINSDENPTLCRQFGVRSIPAVKAVIDGQLVDEFTGALPEGQVRAFIDRLLPAPGDSLSAEAAALHEAGDTEGALAKLIEASHQHPEDETVRLDAAELLISLDRVDEAREILAAEFANEKDRARALRAQLAFAGSTGDRAELDARIAADAGDLAARVELARLLAAGGEYSPALDLLLEVIERDRNYDDGIGRKTMLAMFEAMWANPGLDDLIREYRRKLSAALN